jgi:hypothetical protein
MKLTEVRRLYEVDYEVRFFAVRDKVLGGACA